jgi:hypothetical protein
MDRPEEMKTQVFELSTVNGLLRMKLVNLISSCDCPLFTFDDKQIVEVLSFLLRDEATRSNTLKMLDQCLVDLYQGPSFHTCEPNSSPPVLEDRPAEPVLPVLVAANYTDKFVKDFVDQVLSKKPETPGGKIRRSYRLEQLKLKRNNKPY